MSGAIVRLNIELPSSAESLLSNTQIPRGAVRRPLCRQHLPQYHRASRTRLDGASAEGLAPSELLHRYLESRDTPPDRAEELMRRGQELITEQNSN